MSKMNYAFEVMASNAKDVQEKVEAKLKAFGGDGWVWTADVTEEVMRNAAGDEHTVGLFKVSVDAYRQVVNGT